MKTCSKCKDTLPANNEHFGRDKYSYDKFTHACKKCRAKQYQNWVENNREKERAKSRKKRLKRLGFTQELFNLMLESQDYSCALCKTKDPGANGWQADHDHNTGKARGILCLRCNIGLGFLEERGVEWAKKAQSYVDNEGWYQRS